MQWILYNNATFTEVSASMRDKIINHQPQSCEDKMNDEETATKHYSWLVSDFEIFQRNRAFWKKSKKPHNCYLK